MSAPTAVLSNSRRTTSIVFAFLVGGVAQLLALGTTMHVDESAVGQAVATADDAYLLVLPIGSQGRLRPGQRVVVGEGDDAVKGEIVQVLAPAAADVATREFGVTLSNSATNPAVALAVAQLDRDPAFTSPARVRVRLAKRSVLSLLTGDLFQRADNSTASGG